jgi:uncharacterized protein YbjT (DUF2867 family)
MNTAATTDSLPRTVLLTGATGTVTSGLLTALGPRHGLRLRALVRDEGRAAPLRARGIELYRGDLEDASTLGPAFEGVDALWSVTVPGPRAPEQSMNAIWAARQAGVSQVVRLSAIGAAPDAPSRNGRLHALSDHEIMVSGLRWTILKPHFFMQNLLMAAGAIAAQGALYYAFGEGRLGLVDTRDVGAFAARVLTDPAGHAGKTYTLSGPASLSGDEMARAIGETVGRPVRYVPVPLEAARAAVIGAGASAWIADMLVEYSRAYSEGWGDFVTRDFPRVMGRPARAMAEFVADHRDAFAAAAA